MKHSVEQLGGNMVKVIFEIENDKFEKAIQTVYNRQKSKIQVPGFRKGKVPFQMVVRYYGKEFFYEDALNECMPEAYQEAVEAEGIEVMSRPEVNLDVFKPGEEITVSCKVGVKPEVKLGEYKGLKKEAEAVEVTEEDIDNEIASVAKRNSRKVEVTDRPAQMDDTANIDFEGSIDGVKFEGGAGKDHDLKLGSGSFIPGFEEQIVGKNVGDEFDVNVTFPENYQAADLAGKAAVFACKLNKLTYDEVPEINVEFVQEVSEFDTVEEYREDVKKTLTDRKEKAAADETKRKLIEKAVAGAEMELPEAIIIDKADEMIDEFANSLRYQGMDMNNYMKMTNTTVDQLREDVKPEAERRLKENLTLEAIAKAEGLEVSDEDFEKELSDMAAAYGMDIETVKGYVQGAEEKNMKTEMLLRKAADFIVENAID